MNIKSLHTESKAVSAKSLFKNEKGKVAAIQILKDETLSKHTTTIPALLLCINGEAIFENEKGQKETIKSGDYVNIEPNVLHWVKALKDAQLVLIK